MKASLKLDRMAALLVTACSLALATPLCAGDTVDFSGYGRAGISTTGNGGQQANYGSGALGHYVGRLGDENDTYAELGLGKLFQLDGQQSVQFNSMVSYQTNNGAQFSDYQSYTEPGGATSQGDISLRQLNVVAKGFLPFDKDAALWAGKRYYKREGVDLLDLFYLNNSGYGAGIENVNVGFAKFSAAWMVNQTTSFTGQPNSGGQPYVQVNNLDLRLEGIALTKALSLSFTALYGKGNPDGMQRLAGEPTETGTFLTGELHYKTPGGEHTFVAQSALHGMANMAWTNQSGEEVAEIYPNWGGDLQSATRFILYGEQNLVGKLGVSYSLLRATGTTVSGSGIAETSPFRNSAVLAPTYHENAYTCTILEWGAEKYREATDSVNHSLFKVMLAQELRVVKDKVVDLKLRAYAGAFYGSDAAANIVVDPKGDRGNIRFGIQMAGTF